MHIYVEKNNQSVIIYIIQRGVKMSIKTKKILRMTLYWIVRAFSIAMIVFSIIAWALNLNDNREDSHYIFIILQAVAMIALTYVPALFKKLFKVKIPMSIEILYLMFCASCVVLGEIFEFYVRFSWWDDMLHVFSGSFITVIGFVILYYLNEKKEVPMQLSPGFVVLFCFCFSLAAECVWEAFEYAMDSLVGSNMQRYMDNYTSDPFLGRHALKDTMGDILQAILGSIIFCIIGYIDMKCRTSRLKKMLKIGNVDSEELLKISNVDLSVNEEEKSE